MLYANRAVNVQPLWHLDVCTRPVLYVMLSDKIAFLRCGVPLCPLLNPGLHPTPFPLSHTSSRRLPSQDKAKGGFHAEVDEEFEDAQGNVYNRKTFEDLRRQGLI